MFDKELSPELRLLLAFALSFLILWLARPLMVQPTAPQEVPEVQPEAAAQLPEPDEKPPAMSSPVSAEMKQGTAEEQITVEGDLYQVVFFTRGAAVKSWALHPYRDEQGNPLDLVNPEAAAEFGDPFSFWMADAELRQQVNSAIYVPSGTGTLRAPVTLTFEYNDGRVAARKQFTFARGSYVVEVQSDVLVDGKPVGHALAWRGSFGDVHDAMMRGGGVQVFYREQQKMVRLDPGDVESGESTSSGDFLFGGIEDHFFSAVFLPQDGALRITAFHHEIAIPETQRSRPTLGVAVGSGEGAENRLRVFVGPKSTDVLAAVHPQMGELVDYGWFAFVAKPLFVALRWTHDNVVSNYGWSIMLLTVVINLLLFPLKIKSLRSAMKMQRLQPQVKAIQEKYKQYKMKDPRKQQMQQEMMALYKKHGVNPLGGCLPILFQLPFLYGFYKVLIASIEMRHAPWIGWVRDLSAPEPIFIKVLPLLMCGTQFVLQKMSPATSPDPRQQKIMMLMPVMFLVFFWNLSSGLVLYWLTGNLVGIAQQYYLNRTEMKHLIEEKKAATVRKKQVLARK
ncbi:MAG: membrane protein insertase YidC [Acidobacteria bacterium]|nr:membrane protein insertase YidC [Acidobacteriota bacterium]